MKHRLRAGALLGLASIGLLLTVPAPALADHLSGGSPDIIGFWGGVSLPLMFLGMCGWIGISPVRFRTLARKIGPWVLLLGALIMLGGGFFGYRTTITPNEALGSPAFGRMAVRQIVGTFGVFAGGSLLLMLAGYRQGFLGTGEKVKYVIFRTGDAPDPGAAKPKMAQHNRIGWIPVALMLMVALFMVGGVLWVMMINS